MKITSLLPNVTNVSNVVVSGGIVPTGEYSAGTTYAIGDMVTYNDVSYILYSLASAGTLPTDTTYWQIVADQGEQGIQGEDGEQGIKGDTGAKGDTGQKGDKGYKGDTGDQGIQGIQGIQGETGLTGADGPQGIQGIQGEAGTTLHEELTDLQGGATGDHYHLTGADVTRLATTSGTNTGDQDLSGKENVGVASGLISTHNSTYDHDLIATALQSFTETDPDVGTSLGRNKHNRKPQVIFGDYYLAKQSRWVLLSRLYRNRPSFYC